MQVLVLHAHPVEDSFNAGLHQLVVDRLTARGHAVDACDLYAEGFDPVLSRQERLDYHDVGVNRAHVEEHVARLKRAQALVLVFPVWNYGFPAILKGYFDRVFLPGVSFDLVDGTVQPSLRNIRRLCAVTSYGGTRFRTIIMGDPPRKLVSRWLRATVHPLAKLDYLALYDMNNTTDAGREAFKAKVAARLDRF
ncbi:MAG TPA: NAD(P)H-dependent oxidoreductase [Mesorhizobium sp.]|jgi:putative NADPH-quinone reductase|nr:NAD(P)H-dependent oxidoreductase [Mesorhizobium sp.]